MYFTLRLLQLKRVARYMHHQIAAKAAVLGLLTPAGTSTDGGWRKLSIQQVQLKISFSADKEMIL